jgi:hypothetical protein
MAPPPPTEEIKTKICLDIIETLDACMKTTHSTQSNMTSIQKNYAYSIYYPVSELKKCVPFERYEKTLKIHVNIEEKMNTQLYYVASYQRANHQLHLQL